MTSISTTEQINVLYVRGVPKTLSWKKLKNLITKHAEGILTLQLIPQDSYDILELTSTAKISEKVLHNLSLSLSMIDKNIQINPLSTCVSNESGYSVNTIFDLNYDCLRKIFEYCTVKEQIVIAKVCRLFYEIIRDIWCGKHHRRFVYNPYKMEFEQKLNNENIKEIFAVLGSHVEILRYNTIFYFPMIQRYLADFSGNMVNLSRKLVNINLCRYLMYLENVKVFEVEGKFITDFTVRELARYCKKLRAFRLMDTDGRFLKGEYLYLFPYLEELHIRDCQSFTKQSLTKICKTCNVKSLDIFNCVLLEDTKFIQELCELTPNIENLKLSAQEDNAVLTAVLSLKKLKTVEFFWLAKDKVDFEVKLLEKLVEKKANSLISLKFINDLIPIDNQSTQIVIDSKAYAVQREKTAASGREWNLNNDFDKIIKLLSKLDSLEHMEFEYCRPFSHHNLFELQTQAPIKCKSLKIIGCSTKEDLTIAKTWNERMEVRNPNEKFELFYEALVLAAEVEQFKQRFQASIRNDTLHYMPTQRSIQCCFK